MDKYQRLEKTIIGDLPDRVPVALWQHWAGDDQRAADLAKAHVRYLEAYDWDMLVVVPSQYFMVIDHGLQAVWRGASSGIYDILKTPIHRSLNWTDLRPIDPHRGQFAKQIQVLQLIRQQVGNTTPIIQRVYSPLTQALYLGGQALLLRDMRIHADRLRTGLNSLTETTLRFVDALKRNTQIDGIQYVVDLASYTLLSEIEYERFGLAFDAKVLDLVADIWQLNMVQVNGQTPMLHLFSGLPIQMLNWSTVEARPSLEAVQLDFAGAYCGGLGANEHILLGTPHLILDAARKAMTVMGHRRLILSAGRTLAMNCPKSNLHAVRQSVER